MDVTSSTIRFPKSSESVVPVCYNPDYKCSRVTKSSKGEPCKAQTPQAAAPSHEKNSIWAHTGNQLTDISFYELKILNEKLL
jgi:hypothetical protein